MTIQPFSNQQARFDQLLSQAKQDGETVTPQGKPVRRLTEGVKIRDATTTIPAELPSRPDGLQLLLHPPSQHGEGLELVQGA
jgi:hypothetical protein